MGAMRDARSRSQFRQPRMRERDEPACLGVVLYDGAEPIDVGGTICVVSMAARVLPAIEAAGGPGCRRPVRFHRCAAPRCDDRLRRPRLASGGPGCRYARLPAQPRSASCRLGLHRRAHPRCRRPARRPRRRNPAPLLRRKGSPGAPARPPPRSSPRQDHGVVTRYATRPRHFIETTARPLFPHPRHRTRSFRSSTLV